MGQEERDPPYPRDVSNRAGPKQFYSPKLLSVWTETLNIAHTTSLCVLTYEDSSQLSHWIL